MENFSSMCSQTVYYCWSIFPAVYLIVSNLSRKTPHYEYLLHLLDFSPHRQNGKQTSPKSTNTTANYLLWKAFMHPFPSAALPLKARTILQRSFPCQDVFSCFSKQETKVETLISNLKAPHRQGILTFATVFVIFAHWSSDWWLQRRERAF